ncbi:NADH-quinone oxidoreductase subunit A [Daejeonella sp. H1SJ63]|uniref:NADH-quinone oxidoreductase subunit A n=1 Tax=Daejeonella sp. H1SJ63 TaxID=3034145 RepID=UPI0023EC77E0|nr:NADH-quinone oxidoreductase subunit A [Daejeonella sp. H1SJ63]
MNDPSQISEFGKVLIYLIMGILFVLFTYFMGSLAALKKPNPEKLSSYECGEEPKGSSWIQFNSRFYVIALVFLLFDVEMVFIFPWATVFAQESLLNADPRWGWLSLGEMFVFIVILLIGLVYIWKKGDLNWIKPDLVPSKSPSRIPLSAYENLNSAQYKIKKFSMDITVQEPEQIVSQAPRPAFRPKFNRTTT